MSPKPRIPDPQFQSEPHLSIGVIVRIPAESDGMLSRPLYHGRGASQKEIRAWEQ
jgi:hypothetical protein